MRSIEGRDFPDKAGFDFLGADAVEFDLATLGAYGFAPFTGLAPIAEDRYIILIEDGPGFSEFVVFGFVLGHLKISSIQGRTRKITRLG